MQTAAIDVYVDAFVARCEATRRPGQRTVDAPGVRGLLSCRDDPCARLLVIDDRAHDVLAALLPDAHRGVINVVATARRCRDLLGAHPAWRGSMVTAMVRRDLQRIPAAGLLRELVLRPVRDADDSSNGVPLKDAVRLAMLADPTITEPNAFADYLRSLAPSLQLLAALDDSGAVRATSGLRVVGDQANVMFVNTHPDWRRRGIGRAMTAAALAAARDRGATLACLDASDGGLSIYRPLGFEAAGRLLHLSRR